MGKWRRKPALLLTQEEHGKCHAKVQSTTGHKVPLRKEKASSSAGRGQREGSDMAA